MNSEADLTMEITVGHMLRVGVTVAALVVLGGALLYVVQTQEAMPDYRQFHGTPTPVTAMAPMLHGVRDLDGRSVIQLGILLLVATPVVRVVFCIVGFAAQKDRLYVLVSSVVFAVLIYSLFFRA